MASSRSFPIPTSGSGPRAYHRGPRREPLVHRASLETRSGASRLPASSRSLRFRVNESGPFGIAAGPDGNIWFTEIARSQIGRIGPTRSGAIDLTIGPDNTIRILRFGGGQMAVDSVDNAQAVSPGSPYGPYPGWTPLSMAAGDDSLTRVLWTNDDGTAALWLVGPEGNGVSHLLRAAEGWSATDVAASAADLTHVLWTDADGRTALWSIDNAGNVSAGDPRGPYPGWTAAAIADGEDGLSRVLWHSVDGSTALSLSGPQGLLASYPFGPVAGWTAADIAVGADGQARILWTHVDRRMALWRVDLAGNPTVLGPVYEPPAGFTASRIAAGSDGLTRVLWTNVNGAAVVWVLSADNELEEAFSLDPHPTSDFWDVTIRVTEATGPAFCGYTPGPGMAFSETYDLRRSGDSISFSPPDPFDWPSFTARLKGPNFTAKSRPSARDEACALTIHTPRVSREASRPVAINSPPRRPTPTPSIREK